MIVPLESRERVGPLDDIRTVLDSPQQIDRWLREGHELHDDISELADHVTAQLPFMNEHCAVDGIGFVETDRQRGSESDPLALAINLDIRMEATGIYRGITALPLEDGRGKITTRMVHVLEDPVQLYTFDDYGNCNNFIRNRFFCLDGSEIRPIEPIGFHSFKDLKNDHYTDEIDRLVFNSNLSDLDILRGLSRVLTSMLNSKSFRVKRLNHQRLSYLNSLEFFNEKLIEGREFLIGSPLNGIELHKQADNLQAGWDVNPSQAVAGNVIVLDDYRRKISKPTKRNPGNTTFLTRQKPYIRCVTEDGPGAIKLDEIEDIA